MMRRILSFSRTCACLLILHVSNSYGRDLTENRTGLGVPKVGGRSTKTSHLYWEKGRKRDQVANYGDDQRTDPRRGSYM